MNLNYYEMKNYYYSLYNVQTWTVFVEIPNEKPIVKNVTSYLYIYR